jgi:hypothetical protein
LAIIAGRGNLFLARHLLAALKETPIRLAKASVVSLCFTRYTFKFICDLSQTVLPHLLDEINWRPIFLPLVSSREEER